MKENFERALKLVLDHEGGYVNDPDDPGGETKYGISKRAYPSLDIKNLTVEQAAGIYWRDYWDACSCDQLAYPMDITVFDTAVNCGCGAAKTIRANSSDFNDFLWNRVEYYLDKVKKNPKLIKYIVGWIRRVIVLYRAYSHK